MAGDLMRSIRTCSNVSACPRMAIRLMFAISPRARSRWTRPWPKGWAKRPHRVAKAWKRSEEHTSELQSLMRISYAVFCLKKKKTILQQQTISTHEQQDNI